MSGLVTVVWAKRWDQPICSPADCRHSNQFGAEVLNINQRLEPKNGRAGHAIHVDASICMNCGADTVGGLSLAEGLTRCMDEHGWHAATLDRLYDLAAFHEGEIRDAASPGDIWPIWLLYAWGWTGREIVDALNAGELAGGAA